VTLSQRADVFLSWGEVVVYFAVAVILAAGAALLVGDAVTTFVDLVVEGQTVLAAATELLSVLLLVFVFVELLGAVRKTLRERRLLAEPFLLVGIIASIKEIVVVAGAERPKESGFAEFRDGMVEIGVLSGVVLVLAISALLLRMRQEKPAEEDDSVGSADRGTPRGVGGMPSAPGGDAGTVAGRHERRAPCASPSPAPPATSAPSPLRTSSETGTRSCASAARSAWTS
jgi:uncharacterized membrane protein (DUF373 family)